MGCFRRVQYRLGQDLEVKVKVRFIWGRLKQAGAGWKYFRAGCGAVGIFCAGWGRLWKSK